MEFRNRLRICIDMRVREDGGQWCERYGSYGVSCREGCPEVREDSACDPDKQDCLSALILWGSLYIFSLLKVIVAWTLFLVSSSVVGSITESVTLESQNDGQLLTLPGAKMYIYFFGFTIFVLWVATAISGASSEFANMLTSFSVTTLGIIISTTVGALGFDSLQATTQSMPTLQRLLNLRHSDWIKGLAVITISAAVPFVLIVTRLNQICRQVFPKFTKKMTKDEYKYTYTAVGEQIYTHLMNWDWTSVLRKAVVIGFVYFIVQVGGGKATVVFLAWVNFQVLAKFAIWNTSFYVFAIGLLLFLIPVVPGIPIYITCGIMLGHSGEKYFGSFIIAMAWAVFIAFITKICACAIQQKLIGEYMGKYIMVRAFIKINSEFMRAFRVILQRAGLDKDKVMILIGGPDWPTSVFIGIMKLPLGGILLGTTPILLPVALATIAGGCMLKQGSGGAWSSIATLFLTLTAGAFTLSFLGALLAVERASNDEKETLEQLPTDMEVKKFDDDGEERRRLFLEVSSWHRLGVIGRGTLICSWFFMYVSCILYGLFGDRCFETVMLNHDYREPPLEGNVLNVVKRWTGWGALGMTGISIILYQAFETWATRLVAQRMDKTHGTGDTCEPAESCGSENSQTGAPQAQV